MRTEFKRDMNHNYLVFYGEQEIDTSSYQVRMLVGNVLPSILRCRLQAVDGNMMFYYDITSRQSISSLYEDKKFKREDLQKIFGGFLKTMEEMGEYLLNPGHLVMDPNYVFMDVEKGGLYFCYLPGYEKEVQEQFRSFTEYILPKLDHTDGKAVMLGYGVYRSALEDSFHLEHIKKELYQNREEMPEENHGGNILPQKKEEPIEKVSGEPEDMGLIWESDIYQSRQENEKWKEGKEKKGKEKKGKEQKGKEQKAEQSSDTRKIVKEKAAALIAVGTTAAAMAGILTANYLGYLPWLNVGVALGCGIVVLGITLFLYLLAGKKRLREQKNWRNEVEKNRKTRERQEALLGNRKFPEEEIKENSEDIPLSGKEEEIRMKDCLAKEADTKNQNVGETIVLSANIMSGPASLVSKEPGELATIYLKDDLTVIGKLETACDAVIPYPTVSRVHGKIRKRGEEYYLTDLNSRNGTSVNGRMLKGDEEYLLQDEDEVDFAQARYIFLK